MPEPLTLYLAAPRGFCAGVDRAIKIVEMALEKWGAPVYVRHEIVHNRFVVDGLRAKGAVFVEELAECPPDRPVVFSAHGVPEGGPRRGRGAPHALRRRHLPAGLQGPHRGRAPPRERPADGDDRPRRPPGGRSAPWASCRPARSSSSRPSPTSRRSRPRDPERLAFITQTTLSIDDTAEIVAALRARFPAIVGPRKRGHLLRHHQPPGGGQGDGAPRSTRCSSSAPRTPRTRSASSRSAAAPAAATPSSSSAPPTSTGARSTASAPSASPPAPAPPRCWSRR